MLWLIPSMYTYCSYLCWPFQCWSGAMWLNNNSGSAIEWCVNDSNTSAMRSTRISRLSCILLLLLHLLSLSSAPSTANSIWHWLRSSVAAAALSVLHCCWRVAGAALCVHLVAAVAPLPFVAAPLFAVPVRLCQQLLLLYARFVCSFS